MTLQPVPTLAAVADRPALTGAVLVERVLLAGLTALIVARPLVASDDPGRLRLTSGGGPLTLNLLTLLLSTCWAVWRGWTRRPLTRGAGGIVPVGLLIVAGLVFASAGRPDRYQHPGWFIAWDWVSIAVLCFLAWQLAATAAVARGLTAVLIATAATLSAQALYQAAAPTIGFPPAVAQAPPPSAPPLVGDDEFAFKIDEPPPPHGEFRATLPQPDMLACFLLLVLPAAILWGVTGWRRGGRGRCLLAIPLLLAAGFVMGALPTLTSARHTCASLVEVIERFPLLGGGPGNLSRIVGAGPAAACAFWPGFAATTGLVALGVLVLTLVASVWFAMRGGDAAAPVEPAPNRTRWEFYLGGVAGLLVGMMLATGDIPAEAPASEILRLGVVAGGRALVWFLVFALLESVAIGNRSGCLALSAGVLLVAAAGLTGNALSSPALAQAYWLALTLSLPVAAARPSSDQPGLPWAWVTAPAAAALLAANLLHIGIPGLSTALAVRAAREASSHFPHQEWQIAGARGQRRRQAIDEAETFLDSAILQHLRAAVKNDPGNSALLLELARWDRWQWGYRLDLQNIRSANLEGIAMLTLAERAAELDPRNLGAKLSVYESLLLFTRQNKTASTAQLNSLEKYIGLIAARAPALEVGLRFRVVWALLEQRNPDTVDAWAIQLLRLAAAEGAPHGSLSGDQRARLDNALRKTLPKPSPELRKLLDPGKTGGDR